MVALRTLRPAAVAVVGALIASSCAFAQEVRVAVMVVAAMMALY